MVSNPHFYGQSTTGTPNQIEDEVDFPHTGIIKALSDGLGQNYGISGFDITIDSATQIDVGAGVIFRDGKREGIDAVPNLALGRTNINQNSYHLVVVDKNKAIVIRSPSAQDRVASYTKRVSSEAQGDTIIAMVTHTGNNPMPIQYLTVDKAENSLSIGYSNSGTYTEAMDIQATADRTTFKNKVTNADIRFILADNTADEKFEILSDDDSDGDEGDTEIFSVDGLGVTSVKSLKLGTAGELTITESSDDITIKNTVSNKDITFKVNDGGVDTEVLRLDGSTGNVGIGLSQNVTADEKLDVEDGNISLTTTARQTERVIKLRNSGSTTSLSEIAFAGANTNNFEGYIAFKTKGPADVYTQALNEIMRIDGDGDVGIGTTDPDAKFHVVGGAIVTGGLTIGAGANEFTITESSDDITLANTINDKDIDIAVKNGDGVSKRAKFTADTHSGEVIIAGVEEVIIVALSDETTNLAAGTAKASFHMPYAMLLSKVKASVNTAPTGSVLTVDINEAGASILGTKLTIDAGEFTSDTAATSFAFSGTDGADAALADNALITFDIDGVGSSATGKGLKVTLYGKRP